MGQNGLTEQGLFAYSMYLECPGADRARTLLGIQCKWCALGQTGHTLHLMLRTPGVPQGGQGEQGILLFGYSEHVECPGADRAHSATYVDFTGSALGQTGHIVQLTWSTQGVPRGGQGTKCNLHGLHQECPGADRAHSGTYMDCTTSAPGPTEHVYM